MSNDPQADLWYRRFRLMQILIQRGEIATRNAAQLLNCTRRQALSDLNALERSGIPIYPEGDNHDRRWVLDPSMRSRGVEVDLAQRVALLLGRKLIASFLGETSIGQPLGDMQRQFEGLAPSAQRIGALDRRFFYVYEPEKDYSQHEEDLRQIVDAVIYSYRISFTYSPARGVAKQHLRICPYTLAVYKRGLYLMFEEYPSRRLMTLAVERIQGVEGHREMTFDYPRRSEYDPARALAGRFGITASRDQRPETVRLRFVAEVAHYVRGRRWMPSQEIVDLPDGGCELRIEATGSELLGTVLSFGRTCEVLAPASLRAAVIEELRGAVARYAAPDPT